MKITTKWLDKWNACSDGRKYFAENKISDPVKLANRLIKDNTVDTLSWCNWMIARLLNRENRIRYTCFAAKQVLYIFEEKYPDDKRPRDAINAALKCIEDKSTAAGDAARAAGYAGYSAGYAGDAAGYAAWAAWYAAGYAAWAAGYAGYAAGYAGDAAGAARYAGYAGDAAWYAGDAAGAAGAAGYAGDAAGDAGYAMKIKILKYGITLLK